MSLIEVCRAPRTGPVPLPPGRARERAGPQGRGEAETGLWVSPACPLTGEGEQNFVVACGPGALGRASDRPNTRRGKASDRSNTRRGKASDRANSVSSSA